MNHILDHIQLCQPSTIGGIKNVWVAERQWVGKFWFYEQTQKLQYGRIIGHQSPGNENIRWLHGVPRKADSTFTQTQSLSPSRNYTQTLTLNFNRMDVDGRDTFEQFVVYKNPMFIFQDFNNIYWLIGETNGCNIDWSGQSDVQRGLNQFQIVCSCVERYPIRAVDNDYIIEFVDPGTAIIRICPMNWTEFCNLTWTEVCSSIWN